MREFSFRTFTDGSASVSLNGYGVAGITADGYLEVYGGVSPDATGLKVSEKFYDRVLIRGLGGKVVANDTADAI